MATTIQVSDELKKELEKRKFSPKETYEDIIWDLLEDTMELSAATKRNIAISRKQAAEGKTVSHEQLKRELGF